MQLKCKKKKDLCSVWRRCCDWWNVSKVVCEVLWWDFSLDDVPWWGRPGEVDSDQMKILIENNQHYIMRELANILKISKSTQLLVKIKNVSFILWKKLNRLFSQPDEWPRGEMFSTLMNTCWGQPVTASVFTFQSQEELRWTRVVLN